MIRGVLSLVLLLPLAALADQKSQIRVQGNCELKVLPDRGSISFTVENQSKDQKDAVAKTTAQINKLKEKLTALKLADLEFKNTNYSVFPVREYENRQYVNKGTKALLTLEVTTSEIPRIGEAMDEASKAGVQNVSDLRTFLSLEKSQAEYLNCLDIASEDAKKKAGQLARKLGFKVGDVLEVVENPGVMAPQPEPMPVARGMMKTMDAAPTQIEAGLHPFTASILVSFGIK